MHKIYISYAWGDNGTDGGDSREQAVDCLCEAFAQRGYHVVRDKQDMPYRKPIREFMNELAGATALIAVISEKYLRSPYCMYELTAAWDRGDFRHRIFPIVLPDARISPQHALVGGVSAALLWQLARHLLVDGVERGLGDGKRGRALVDDLGAPAVEVGAPDAVKVSGVTARQGLQLGGEAPLAALGGFAHGCSS